ncbi:MAG: AAA family ATPase [Candidatus Magnetomorum sp.]|nr:AAA family ATPase [Candidatus Magnetomorum sp.]
MIQEIRIQKYKSIKDVSIGLETPMTALVGKTGAGKTNVLEGIYLACVLAFSGSIPQSNTADIPRGFSVYYSMVLREKPCWYQFKFLFKKDRYFIQDSFTIKEGRKKIEIFGKRDPFTVKVLDNSKLMYIPAETSGLNIIKKMLIQPELPDEFSGLSTYANEIAGAILDFSRIQYFRSQSQLDPALFLEKDFDLWRKTQFIISEDLRFSFELYDLFKNKPKQFETFARVLRELDIVEEIQASEITAKDEVGQEYHCLVWRFLVNGKAFPFTCLSQGARRIIQMLFNLHYHKTALILIQQLESSIHYALFMDFLNILQEHAIEKKVLFSSYSEHIFKFLKPEQMIYLYNKNNATKARRLKSRHMGPLLSHLTPKESHAQHSGKFLTISYRGRRLLG